MAQQPLVVEFWDVGQGDCSVIHLPSGEIILIDVGPRGNPISGWLISHGNIRVHSIVLTHNDADHIGALNAVVDGARSRIGTVYFLEDRSRKDDVFVRLVRRLDTAKKCGEVTNIRRLEAPRVLWSDSNSGSSLEVKFPPVLSNIMAPSANETAGVLSLSIHSAVKILWASDTTIENVAAQCQGSRPEYLVGPHHGAPADRGDKRALAWLKSVSPRKVVVSVGSGNDYKHPQVNYIRDVRTSGGAVVCTQLTPRCENKRKLRDVIKSHARLGLPQPNSGFTCRGPIRLTLEGGDFVSNDTLDVEHAVSILKLKSPRCVEPF